VLEIGSDDYLTSSNFKPRERAAVLWAEHVAKNTARTRDDVFDEVKRHFNDQELVELTGVCGLFGQSNRFQDSMRLPIEEQAEVDKIKASVQADPARIKVYLERIVQNWPSVFPRASSSTAPTLAAPSHGTGGSDHPGSARVPLLEPQNAPPDAARFLAAARDLLGGASNAVRVWAHIPHIGKLFLPLFAVFTHDGAGSILPTRTRLLTMLRNHHVHSASYLLAHHTVLARSAGLTQEEVAAACSSDVAALERLAPAERAAVSWAELVARNQAKRDESVFKTLQQHFTDAEVVELTALCALSSYADLFYNALRVPVEARGGVDALNASPRLDPSRVKRYVERVLEDWPSAFPVPDAAAAA
jgi:alkylhydroperoxidase family enzyme